MLANNPQTVFLKDYAVPDFLVDRIDLQFDLFEDYTDVVARTVYQRNPKGKAQAALVLDGEKVELQRVSINGQEVPAADYQKTDTQLILNKIPAAQFTLEIATRIKPQENLSLEGLYKSNGKFCTQCEAQGFRKITYFMDRPDVMTKYSTTITAEKARYPFLLSNGNKVEAKELPGGRHLARWEDPFRKPAYLFALVAGDLGRVHDTYQTKTGRTIQLEIFVDKGNENRTHHAMESLKKSMRWDEDTFGLEYDLDIFMIVAVNDFNFGAMENKGLNIFNARLLLADSATATDVDYERIEGVVAHEYFHNWTGNRITCRDWFQLSLKEGLTVYRDQEFSSDMTSRAVKRIDDVSGLRSMQFAEDAGPMAHPIRPSSYIEINNFYTATVYEKGAEVIRMIATILGKQGFRKGMDKYFELHDGQAVTTEDFVHAMEVASGADLKQFRDTWYTQAGTPLLKVKGSYDRAAKKYELTVEQSCAPSPGQAEKNPYHIPLAMALLDEQGKDLVAKVLAVKKAKETFTFEDIKSEPVPSLLRGFSAPVKLQYDYSKSQLLFLLAKDTDSFSRFEAGQTLALNYLRDLIANHAAGKSLTADKDYLEIIGLIAADDSIDPAFRARLLELPEENYLAQQQSTILPESLVAARNFLHCEIARHNEKRFVKIWETTDQKGDYHYGAKEVGIRKLRSVALEFLTATGNATYLDLALNTLKAGKNMTEEMSALKALIDCETSQREQALDHFYNKWNKETLVMDKWFAMQAISKVPGGLERVKKLRNDPLFQITNPNKVRSLFVAFGYYNIEQFHRADGASYEYFADLILELDSKNPSVAARLVSLFNQWKKFDTKRQELAQKQLRRLVEQKGVSPGVFEIASKALQ